MGKRRSKLLNKTYFQCDLTQYPLKRPLCHFPVWKTAADGAERLTRLGSYANWECVLIDALKMKEAGCITEPALDKIYDYVEERTGVPMTHITKCDPTELAHFGGSLDFAAFQRQCEEATMLPQVRAVVVPYDKALEPYGLSIEAGPCMILNIITALGYPDSTDPEDLKAAPVAHRARMSKERGLELFYLAEGGDARNLGCKNQRATNIAKTSVAGNALLLQHSIEPGRLSKRHTHYPIEAYYDVFTRAKKKPPPPAAPVGLSGEEFAALKAEMLVSSSSLEAQLSAGAQTPQQLGKMKPLPPLSGKSLARRSAQKQAEKQAGLPEPPPVQRQAAERGETAAA